MFAAYFLFFCEHFFWLDFYLAKVAQNRVRGSLNSASIDSSTIGHCVRSLGQIGARVKAKGIASARARARAY